ncbi:predicted protein [Botrytis cinerea T4]|uniref:Uncharacterized protein n=1 Tax=Botryotinia fuckeliana (strain T4) TaxID=999810 RepID=G2YRT1_BOTF4|nr:predicted protein [Botrytis cinerea T4]
MEVSMSFSFTSSHYLASLLPHTLTEVRTHYCQKHVPWGLGSIFLTAARF